MNAQTRLLHIKNLTAKHLKPQWKAGWREIGGVRKYYRSRWEANYARYLNWLVAKKQLNSWAHETTTFWFPQIKRGVCSYLPDFEVETLDGKTEFHEVKGYLDSKSKTKLKRMAKYHPEIKVVLISQKLYLSIEKAASALVQGWEI